MRGYHEFKKIPNVDPVVGDHEIYFGYGPLRRESIKGDP